MEEAPPANDVAARRQVLDRAREHYRMGEIGLAWRACADLAELSRLSGDAETLADAATVIRRPIDPVTRARVHALAAEALGRLGDDDPVRRARLVAQLEATADPFHPEGPPPPSAVDDPEAAFLALQARIAALQHPLHCTTGSLSPAQPSTWAGAPAWPSTRRGDDAGAWTPTPSSAGGSSSSGSWPPSLPWPRDSAATGPPWSC